MPTETALFVAAVVTLFAAFAGTMIWVDVRTRS